MAALANDIEDCNRTVDADRRIKACTGILGTAYLTRGIAYYDKDEYDKAIADYTRAIELDPNGEPAYNNRGLAYYYKGEYGRAIADLNRAIELDPKSQTAYNNRGNAYKGKREYDKALDDYNRAIELDPNYALAYNNRGTAYAARGEYARAIADFNRGTKLDPAYELAYRNRGDTYKAKGEYDRAIADYNRAIELNPKDAKPYRQLGIAKFDSGDFKDASGGLLRSLELNDDRYAMLYRYLARARAGETLAAADLDANSGRLKTKEWPYAVIEFYLGKRSLELTLDAAAAPAEMCEAQFYIGEWYLLQNKPAEAQTAFGKAVETCPKDFLEYASAQAELKRLKP
jgi:tetratricopeptide (TPR) repeat protein